jgi:hypothetical protein
MEEDEFAGLVESIKKASSIMPVTFNKIDLSANKSMIEDHINAIDGMVQEDISFAASQLSNLEVLSNTYNNLLLEEKDITQELNMIRKNAMEVEAIASQIKEEKADLTSFSDLLAKEQKEKEDTYLKLSSGLTPLDLELAKYRMGLVDFLQLPLRTASSDAVKEQIAKIASQQLNEETETEQ